ncbi:Na+/H+ antiporter NhaC [Kordiimonas lipolytica]|uniref:Na+/H+ antiporter NhaC n=1 Tax=Kordiimonas lipolytica TaxID=1662421 RepID=A0ABV8U9A4_9PROT|nr:Na+/H+ antiporter NhaC [Kordiimonas lipolytica]
METEDNHRRGVGIIGAVSVVLFLLVAIGVQVFVLGNTGSTQVTLIIVTAFATIVAMASGYSWHEIQNAILYGCNMAMLPMMILMMVGLLIASWTAAGTIPALIYFGIKLLNPDYFLFSAALICSIGSLSTGSSWTTAATFGVGFMGIGLGLGIPPEYTAGAVISGSIFGDKMSPLSDSTNLASAVAQAELFDHIKSMIYTTVPAILIALVIYLVMGLMFDSSAIVNDTKVQSILDGISGTFSLNPITLLPPVLVVVLIMRKMSGLAVMIIASLVGMALATGLQGYTLDQMLVFMNFGFESSVGIPEVDKILSGGGLQNMMWTVSLGFIALSMGGVMEKTGMLEVILTKIRHLVHSTGGLVVTHVFSSFAVNLLSASQFMALIIPARMLVPVYRAQKLLPQVCSRVSEDSATATSPLVPWGLGGVYYTSVLGVATLDYLPYTFFGLIVPAVTIVFALTNTCMFREGDIESKRTYSSVPAE